MSLNKTRDITVKNNSVKDQFRVFVKVFKNNVWSDDTDKVSLLHYQMKTYSAVNRNLACVVNTCNNSPY